MPLQRKRIPLLLLAVAALLTGLWAGLTRMAVALPAVSPRLIAAHGPLMVGGFLGTLIGLERAVALSRRWAYAAPLLTALGGVVMISGVGEAVGRPGAAAALVGAGSTVLLAVFVAFLRRQATLAMWTMTLAVCVWWVGNVLWMLGRPLPEVVLWWNAFLIVTIAGERLLLNRVLQLRPTASALFLFGVTLLVIPPAFVTVARDVSVRLMAAGMLVLGLWLSRHDIARRNIRGGGLTRFMAACLLAAYGWLVVSGLLLLRYGAVTAGPAYDAVMHGVLLGFVFSMIFAHAPVVFPAVLGVDIPFRKAFWVHAALLHGSLVLRIVADVAGWIPIRQTAGVLNAVAIILFFANTVLAVRSERRNRTSSEVVRA